MSLLLVAVLVCLLSGITGVGAKGVHWFSGQDSTSLRRLENDNLGTLKSTALGDTPLERPVTPRRTQAPAERPQTTPSQTEPRATATTSSADTTKKRKQGGMQFNDIVEGKAVDSDRKSVV